MLFASCAAEGPSMLEPAGPAAARVESLWWVMFWISAVILAVVVILIAVSVRRRGEAAGPLVESEAGWGNRFIAICGVAIPWVILTSVFVLSLNVMKSIADQGDDSSLTIRVDGRMWWWDVTYPGGVRTANEIHVPLGERVRLVLTAGDVIHSFWVPQLQVKADMIPGKENILWLQADEPGRYRGQCAEYCGIQHANMIFYVVAEPRAQFDQWLANEARPAADPADEEALRGREVFLANSCFGCHAIRGTPANAALGPDLTHLARRNTLASGILANNRENLARFITQPQEVKPGDTMPPSALSSADLSALLDYLGELD